MSNNYTQNDKATNSRKKPKPYQTICTHNLLIAFDRKNCKTAKSLQQYVPLNNTLPNIIILQNNNSAYEIMFIPAS